MDKYNWDLTRMYKNYDEFKKDIDEVTKLLDKLVTYKGKLMESSESLYEALSIGEKVDYIIEKLYVYSHLGFYENMASVEFMKYKEEAINISNKAGSMTSFMTPEILSYDYSKVEKYINENSKLEKYKKMLKDTFRYKDHTLSEKEEKLLSELSDVFRVPSNTYDQINNVDVKFDKIKNEEGKKVELTSSNFSVFMTSKDRNVRKEAFNKKYKYYKEHINTISSLYIGKVKTDSIMARVKGYDSALERYLFPDMISKELYETLIKVTNKNTKYLKEYYKLKSEALGYKLHMYDLYVNTSNAPIKKITYEEAIKMVNEALKPLGEKYLTTFNYLLNNRCVDVYPKDKKRSGAYQWGSYKVLPYVSLNYENNIDSVSTLAHEMGHAMHSYLSDNNQEFIYAQYPIFLAEIASTVNEILLSEYLINHTDDKDEKEYYLIEFLDKFKATVYRQAMFAEFESIVHSMYESGECLTMESLCDTYLKLNKNHFSPVVKVDDTIKYEWARIPHFYTPFYVYKYSTGFISALVIADKLLNTSDFRDKYLEFLKSGGSEYPLDLLNKIGIDLTDEKVLERAFEIFNEKLELLKK